jgi:hypothetical protein
MSPGTLKKPARARPRLRPGSLLIRRSTVLDRFDLAVLDLELAVVAGAFTGADELNGRCTDIVDVAAVLEDLQRLGQLAGIDLLPGALATSMTFSFSLALSVEPAACMASRIRAAAS